MFWGFVLEPKKRYNTTVTKPFHISMAALDPKSINDNDISSLVLNVDGTETILCNLGKPNYLQERLDLNFIEGNTITLEVKGKAIVHLSGYFIYEQDGMDDEDDSDLDEEESVDDEELEEADQKALLALRKKMTKNNKSKFNASTTEDDSDDDDDDDDDEDDDDDDDEEEEEEDEEEEEEEDEKPRAQRSSVVAVQQEKSEEDEDAAAPEDEADKESEAEEEEEQGEGEDDVEEDKEAAEDREEGEIEGSPPPVWSGEQRTWGVSKPNTVFKFLRARDPDISTAVLKEYNTLVKPLAEDFLDARERDTRREAPVEAESSGEDAAQPAEARDRRDSRRRDQEEEKQEEEGEQQAEDEEEEERGERKSKERERGEEENENPNAKKRKRSEEKEERERRKSSPVRKVLIKKDKDVSPRRSHRPPTVPLTPTNVLYIYNLTRPFTLGQLRELLSRTGKIATDGFWIDNIKSKCYVEYETEDQAEETRHALHEVRWPVTNDKVLRVEFTSKDAMLNAQIKAETAEMPTQRKTEPLIMDRNSQRLSVREWDMGKVPEEEDKSRDRDRNRTREREEKDRKRKDRRYSESPSREEPDARRRKRDIEAPAKLLDDLFRKTKTTPCLYWLPLTAEQIAVKEEMRKKHLAELEKRMKKNTTSSRSSRDRGSRRARRS
uniref:Apoptotic chromatin condensation inducer in the nucleus n=1 Tax=Cacopsylla melanoneura TaxID=428564 RepID=A0A8D8SB80_9HEMI